MQYFFMFHMIENNKEQKSSECDDKIEDGIYIIQKHDATHLHYDLRLEMDDVLKSWVLPKTPPIKKGVKRLAIQTDDHALDHANFQGEIPKGLSGAGSVEIWDKGTYSVEIRTKDKLVVRINGDKLKGRFCFIKFKDQHKNWLFFKC